MYRCTSPHRPTRAARLACATLAACAPVFASGDPGATGAGTPVDELEHESIEIIGTSPAPGLGRAAGTLPANVQAFTGSELVRERNSGVAALLAREGTGVSLASLQGNAFQPDLVFRGFTASPLLGSAQGLSVFIDGVRVNDPFGERVPWDLLPTVAIANLQLLPGSSPAFGANTLGGALALYTKDGREHPGAAATASIDSHGQRGLEAELGGTRGHWDGYVAASDTHAPGWAQHNASRVRLLFAKLGYRAGGTDIDLGYSGGNNHLEGTQLLPASWQATPTEAYTWPDAAHDQQQQLALKASSDLGRGLLLSATAYLRMLATDELDANVDEDALASGAAQPAGGNATNDRLRAQTHASGAALQLSWQGALAGRTHALTLALSHDRGDIDFLHAAQSALFSPTREAVGSGGFATVTDLALGQQSTGLALGDAVTLAPHWTLDVSGRHTRALARSRDRSGQDPALDAAHSFSQRDGALGLTWHGAGQSTAYANFGTGTRMPTPAELSCADPAAPCTLANSFVADPPLQAVRARTLEFGIRGPLPGGRWRFAAFRTRLDHDIQMVATGNAAIATGYFSNVGSTERRGLEFTAQGQAGKVLAQAALALTQARYLDPWRTSSPGNAAADATGVIDVRAGDRLPGVPASSGHLRLAWAATPAWQWALEARGQGSSWSRGDENNADPRGRLPGWLVLDADANWQPAPRWRIEAGVHNLFDRAVASAGALALNVFNGPGRSWSATAAAYEGFRSPAAPRSAWLQLVYGP
jgi:iron complex outermembrane recepter protein